MCDHHFLIDRELASVLPALAFPSVPPDTVQVSALVSEMVVVPGFASALSAAALASLATRAALRAVD